MTVEFDPFAGPAFDKSAATTESQREIFAASQWGGEASCAYNESCSLRLTGPLDTGALRDAFAKLFNRHEALRMFFSKEGHTLFIRPHNGTAINWKLVDLTFLPEAERVQELAAVLAREVETPFDLENDLLLKATLVKSASDVHQFVLTGHHIVVDGWSWGVLLKELGALYSAEHQKTQCSLPPASGFVQYAINERAAESGQAFAQVQSYWLKQFPGPTLPELDLPVDRKRPTFKTYSSRRVDFPLSKELTDKLKKTGAKLGASYFVSLLAGVVATLHRLTRRDDLVIGIPAAGQAVAGEQNLVGHCVNLLPLRFTLTNGMAFTDLIKVAQTVMLDGLEHQQLSYGALLKQLAIKRDSSRLPLISVIFNLDQSLIGNELGFVDLDVNCFTNPRHFENFELFINASETMSGTVLEVQYNTDLFDKETVSRWLENLQTLLESATSTPNTQVDRLNLLPFSEREKLLKAWNDSACDFMLNTTVHELFEAQVDKTPDAVALQFGETKISYRELDSRSNQLAHYLRNLGVVPDRLVAIFTERSIEMVIGMIAVHKAGGAYVPLDPNYPQERVRFIQKDANAAILLTQASLLSKLSSETGVVIVAMDADWSEIAKESSERLGRTSEAKHLSHVIYTSGSTGQPKGVAIEHKSTVNFCYWASCAFTAVQRDGVLFSTSICFDLSVFELFATLVWGGRVVLVENALALAALPTAADVRLVNSVPSVLATVLKTAELPATVQVVNLAGEPLKDDLVSRLYGMHSIKDVYDLYGPSETTTYSTYTRRVAGGRPTIGRPLANTAVYVLDESLQLLPQGVPGELFIGGAGVARGYLDRVELTSERFVEDPFSEVTGARMYRTGDLVRWLSDGSLEYLGRIDHQVKVRGFRVELGEIESVLLSHAAIREAAVTARDDVSGDMRLVAYVVPKDGDGYTDMELRKHLRKSLPDYMVPQIFIELGSLPLTPNGKVDRKALPAPITAVAEVRMLVSPRTNAEQLLAELFQETLKVGSVSVHDNFFDLGGHSLLCFQVIAKVQEKTGVKLNPRLMLLNSLEQIAAALVLECGNDIETGSVVQSELKGNNSTEKQIGFAKKMLQKVGF